MMASLTIDELKKALIDHGVDLPTGRAKKEEYVKLFEENITLNPSLGETYSSDNENESSPSTRRVTSTNGNTESQDIAEDVEGLSNDDLFVKLKELGYNAGPVVPNTRRVYEKKLVQLLRGGPINGDNYGVDYIVDASELSDSEVQITQAVIRKERSTERQATPLPSSSRRESSREPASSVPVARHPSSEPSIPRRISYIEKIPRGSSQRIIEPMGIPGPSSELRQRPVGIGSGDHYVGRWSPSASASRFNAGTLKPTGQTAKSKIMILAAVSAVLVILLIVIYFQWSAYDPYKQIEDDVEQQVKELADRKPEK